MRSGFLLLGGVALCCNFPIMRIGDLPWPAWLTVTDFGLLLLLIAGIGQRKSKEELDLGAENGEIIKFLESTLLRSFIAYSLVISALTTIYFRYPVEYPLYAVCVIIKWYLAALVLVRYGLRAWALMTRGLMAGIALNVCACLIQWFGYPLVGDLFPLTQDPQSGPWHSVESGMEMGGGYSVGIFSYSRIATGTLLAIGSYILLFGNNRISNIRTVLMLGFILLGIATTGGRTGFYLLTLILAGSFFIGRKKLTAFSLASVLVATLVIYGSELATSDVVGRLLGQGNQGLSDAIGDRTERQHAVFSLGFPDLVWGCGLGNLGSAISGEDVALGLNMYRAHGYLYTYLGEVGIIGIAMLFILLYKLMPSVEGRGKYFILAGFIIALGFSDDFLAPSSQAGNTPIILLFAVMSVARKAIRPWELGEARNVA